MLLSGCVSNLLDLAFAKQRRWPDCPNSHRPRRHDVNSNGLCKTLRLFHPCFTRPASAFPRKFRDSDNRALAAGDLDRTIAVKGAQDSPSGSGLCSLPRFSG